MEPAFEHAGVASYLGDNRKILRALPEKSVHTCVTSPPYFGLRDYGTATWQGGDADCAHQSNRSKQGQRADRRFTQGEVFKSVCGHCGAERVDMQIGLEPTPAEFVAALVDVFRELRRVLRDDGTVWLNLGDSYSAHAGQRKVTDQAGIKQQSNTASAGAPSRCVPGLGHKQLIGIPWRVAFALQEDGWYLRSDCIWAKPNPMPESVTDRPTKAHEYLFLLSKSAKYYYDSTAIAEPVTESTVARLTQPNIESQNGSDRVPGKTNGNMKAVGPRFGGGKYGDLDEERHRTKSGNEYTLGNGTRNKRTVWTVATQPCTFAHFATFPPELIRPCIRAGAPVGGIVLDPFFGSGTTGLVARQEGRRCIGIDLNPEYIEIQKRRLNTQQSVLELEVA